MTKKWTCKQALDKLTKGNQKHAQQCRKKGLGEKTFQLKETDPGQRPYAAILSCADSRVIPEEIFCAGKGELFVVRVAGNISSPETIASLEYAVKKLYVPLILVLGHEKCGAVESAIDFAKDRLNLGYNLNQLISYIIPAVNVPTINDVTRAVKKNATLSAAGLTERSLILESYQTEKKLLICSAYYHFSGRVESLGTCKCPT